MFGQLFTTVLAPILGLFVVATGNGFISSLTTLRLDSSGASAMTVGLISSAYFIGLTIGAFFNDRLIARVGHIRAYSSFVSVISVTFLLQGLFSDPAFWLILRLVNGWATLGVFLVVESWLLLAGTPRQRGRLLALYMISFYGSTLLGQLILGAVDAAGATVPFIVGGMLASLSVLPMVIIPRISPVMERVQPLRFGDLLRTTSTGVVGCFGSGVAIAAIYTLLPLYLQHVGMNVDQVGSLMSATILGAMLLQYPVGRWSDHKDRQTVLIALGFVCVADSLLILLLPSTPAWLCVPLFLLGGGIFAIYPVAVSHSADKAGPDALVRMIQGLLLINSVGSAVSPMTISLLMEHAGAAGFFWAMALLNLGMAVFFVWRRGRSPAGAPVAPFEPATQMSPVGVEIRVTEDLMRGAMDQAASE
ncbi:MFS transporter [Bordetella genomosp. 10]|uniref:MFS transporter n=1 Tax=Bordetella genomosp. 10 TaxID=1416804 RepID=A0A261SL51_9BORD|nr:MFS transporter [Bordetella genomosp. 10]OZI37490.1 MFS transporter [Bordetella genomosp. 10]